MGQKYSLTAMPQWCFQGWRHYGKSGYKKASKHFDQRDMNVDLTSQNVIVTGGSSGLGKAAVIEFAKRNASLYIVCRDRLKGQEAMEEIMKHTGNQRIYVQQLDVSDFDAVKRFADDFNRDVGSLHVLVNNAGAMKENRELTSAGVEHTLATMLGGCFLLTGYLMPSLRNSPNSRVINVSSGGMYTVKMDPNELNGREGGKFDGTHQYAVVKRAMVYLTQLMADKTRGLGVSINSMHPGWVNTPGVKKSMPKFYKRMKSDLRTPAQGADTIAWLGISEKAAQYSGLFFFDRSPVKVDLSSRTKAKAHDIQEVWRKAEEYTKVTFSNLPGVRSQEQSGEAFSTAKAAGGGGGGGNASDVMKEATVVPSPSNKQRNAVTAVDQEV